MKTSRQLFGIRNVQQAAVHMLEVAARDRLPAGGLPIDGPGYGMSGRSGSSPASHQHQASIKSCVGQAMMLVPRVLCPLQAKLLSRLLDAANGMAYLHARGVMHVSGVKWQCRFGLVCSCGTLFLGGGAAYVLCIQLS